MEIEHNDIVLCNVEKIMGETVFVKIDGIEKQGTIILSEIAAGRIRNLRDYVVPKKTIICKVLRIMNDHIELSLRRVNQKEQKELMAQYKIEKSYIAIMKTILKEKTKEIIQKIKKTDKIYDFLENAKKDSKELEKIIGKNDTKKIIEILNSQKKKTVFLKKEITITTSKPNGVTLIKKLFEKIKKAEIRYLSGGLYSIKIEEETIKKADQEITKIIENLEKQGKPFEIQISQK